MQLRLVLPAFLAAFAALVIAGCGGGDDGGSGGADPASVAPPTAPVFIEFTLRPEGEVKANVEALAQKIAGIDDLGALIISELESSAAGDDEEVDFEQEIEPWLGDEAGLFLQEYEEDDFEGYGVAIQATDEGAARDFVDEQIESDDESFEDGSYEGVEFKVQEDETTIGVFDSLVVFAEDEAIFKSMVDASEGENLAGEDDYSSAVGNVPDDSAADVYVDIGGLVEESGGAIDDETQLFLNAIGIEPDEATAVASLVPGADHVEIDLSTNLSGENPPSGDASELLGSLPGSAVGAFSSAEFGDRFNEAIDQIDEEGIPGEVPPNQLKKTLKQAGIDLEGIAASIGDVGVYLEGGNESSLRGAVVMEAKDATQAENTVTSIGTFLRAANVAGVTALGGKVSGFSIRDSELGSQPVVVAVKGSRIVVGYGLRSALAAFEEAGRSLADLPEYEEAVSALGGMPITAFVDGPGGLNLASGLIGPGDEDFEAAKPYLRKIDYLALGSEASDGLATAKLIVGLK